MNNFDQSSSGLNLELSVFWDLDQARWLFDENFQRIEKSDMLEYIEYGNINQSFDLGSWDNFTFTKKDIIEALKKDSQAEFLNDESKRLFDKPLQRLTKSELTEFCDNWLYYKADIYTFQSENLKPNYYKICSRGHCQGDYCEIILTKKYIDYITKECNKPFGKLLPSLQKEINHLLWDQPIYGRLLVNDNEYYLDELCEDLYTYDKDRLIAQFTKVYNNEFSKDDLKIIVDFLDENLPEYPDHR